MSFKLTSENGTSRALLANIENTLLEKGYKNICGVDEVGRGPLAGPVVAAAVIIPVGIEIDGLDDSKKLSEAKRDELFEEIIALEIPCAVGIIDNQQIDRMNILKASLVAMRKAVTDLKVKPDIVLVDGEYPIPNIGFPQLSIVDGDALCKSIMAASIVAKVTRDRIMDHFQKMYPSFSFAKHKGYSTAEHLKELKVHGPCDIHRKSFRPVAELIPEFSAAAAKQYAFF
ncbi:MAG: ribonuclease HII [Candidatus Zixiibacteriota bacterium]